MKTDFKLEEYLSNGVDNIVKGALKASWKNPKESLFLTRFSFSCARARKIRITHEKLGEHIPPFLIGSITNSCNLQCKGCYARANHICGETNLGKPLEVKEWGKIFNEASKLGIGFFLLAGGEPFMRREVIEEAAKYKNILFPIFTNGTLFDETYLSLFNRRRNLLPVLSIEGEEEYTDQRRGKGVFQTLNTSMKAMKHKGIFYGASITVTRENVQNVTGDDFLSYLYFNGCKVVFYVEYVPINGNTKNLAPTERERDFLARMLQLLRIRYVDMLFISFPGDEKSSGGCLAAGRGFFHINPYGKTEPCPFSPYSDTDLREKTILEALKSPLFQKLKDQNILMQEHIGGCVLFEQEEEVKKLNNMN
jgi:MoaA/NifB/PqqE/SkfB family radical SAM enzyme